MFKQFVDLDFSASTAIQTDEKENVAIENSAKDLQQAREGGESRSKRLLRRK